MRLNVPMKNASNLTAKGCASCVSSWVRRQDKEKPDEDGDQIRVETSGIDRARS